MKRELLQVVAFTGMLFIAGSNVTGQIITSHSPQMHGMKQSVIQASEILDRNKYDVSEHGDYKMYIPKENPRKAVEKDSVAVHFQLTYDKEKYDLSTLGIYNTESEAIFRWYMETEEIVLSVPVGTYDICCLLTEDAAKEPLGNIWLIKEQISLSKDTVIVFDAKDATNLITVETYNPEGELCRLPIIKYKDDYTSYETLEEGNIVYSYSSNHMILKDYGMYYTYSGDLQAIIQNESYYGLNILRTNKVSDRYIFGFSRISGTKDGLFYVNKYEVSGVDKNITLKNNPQDFVAYKESFEPSLKGKDSDTYGMSGVETYITYKGIDYQGVNVVTNTPSPDKENVNIYIDAPKTDEFNVMVAPVYGDMQHMQVYEEKNENGEVLRRDTAYFYTSTTGLPVFVAEDNIEYASIASGSFTNTEDWSDPVIYPGHQAFSYTDKEKLGIYGNSSPINVFSTHAFYSENLGTHLFFARPDRYVGRLGESRETDNLFLETIFKYKGNVIEELPSEKQADGIFDLTYINNNIEVDGISGKNITHVVFDQSKEDWIAPTLQMLQFRDQNDKVTDRFITADEGILQFAGGDFNYKEVNYYWSYYDCQPVTIAVSYAPYSKDTWQALPVEEISDLYRMPGFGYFYQGSLARVTSKSENGWYDLKITLTDLSGNQQTQTISPAFKIGEGSGIPSATVENIAVYVDNGFLYVKADKTVSLSLYTMAGTKVYTGTDAVNNPLSTVELPVGIYMAEVMDHAGNVSLHKVAIK